MRDPGRTRALIAAIVAAATVPLLALLVALGVTDPFDAAVAELVRVPALSPLGPMTQLGSVPAIVAVAALVLLLGWFGGRWLDAMSFALAIGLAAGIIELVKLIVSRARPELLDPIITETGHSFPSGHAANAMVAYGILALLIGRMAKSDALRALAWVVAGIVVIGVGLSRVWLGVHYPSDVVAGWLLGLSVVALVAGLTRPAPPVQLEEAALADPAAPRSGPPAAG